MRRLYRAVKTAFINLYYWALDYAYVTYWQLRGLVCRCNAANYVQSGSTKDPVLIIPGVYESWQFMKPVAGILYAQGYSVHVVESLGYNTGSVEEMAERVQEYVRKNQIEHYSIVAHSKGGLIAKYLLGVDGQAITNVIAINTPFSGSVYARLFPFKSLRLFLPTSALIMLLAQDIESNKKIISIYSRFDPHIPGSSFLDGAENVLLDTGGHFRILQDVRLQGIILRSLA